MHYAARNNAGNVIRYLLDNKANPDVPDEAGDTPSQLLDGQGANDIQEMMQRHSDKTHQKLKFRNSSTASIH